MKTDADDFTHQNSYTASFINGDECLCHYDSVLQAPSSTLLPLLVPAGSDRACYHCMWEGERARKGRTGRKKAAFIEAENGVGMPRGQQEGKRGDWGDVGERGQTLTCK